MGTVSRAPALGAAAIIGYLGHGPVAASTGRGHALGTDHGKPDRRDENRRAQLHLLTGRSRTGGGIRCRPSADQRRGRAGRLRPCEQADARRDRKASAAIPHVVFALRDP
jgi:hypothetical protein